MHPKEKGPSHSIAPHRSQLEHLKPSLRPRPPPLLPEGTEWAAGGTGAGYLPPTPRQPPPGGRKGCTQTRPLRVRKRSHRAGTCNFLAARGL